MLYNRFLGVLIIILWSSQTYAQYKDSSSEFKFSGYVDAYYARYSDATSVGMLQQFASVSPKNNELGLNIAQISAQYAAEKARATVTLHYGDLVSSAWSPQYNMIQEANAGIKLGKKVWLDAGFFKTHIGTEAFLPKDNITSSITMITLYEPWFQSGAKLTYQPNDKYLFCFHVLNGYNTFVDNNSKKSIGMAVTYTMGDKGSLGYYNLIGDELPDSVKSSHVRFLNNVVFNYQFTPKFKTVIGVDYIGQQNSGIADATQYASVYSALATLRFQLKPKLACYGRFELYNDADGFLSGIIKDANGKLTGYKSTGYTLGLESKFTPNSYIRLEGRDLIMDATQQIFRTDGMRSSNRLEFMFNVGVWF